jgi:hypothetical protein
MTWITLYITGKSDFRDIVRKKLDHSELNFMPGYVENLIDNDYKHDLYWVDDTTDLRLIKEAIGGKTIWKYRLRFFISLEEFIAYQEELISKSDSEEEKFPLAENYN